MALYARIENRLPPCHQYCPLMCQNRLPSTAQKVAGLGMLWIVVMEFMWAHRLGRRRME